MRRLEMNWSQETLCIGICAVSYLSKIEQGRVQPNSDIIHALFNKLGIDWKDDPQLLAEFNAHFEQIYDDIYSRNWGNFTTHLATLSALWDNAINSPLFLDLLCLKAFMCWDQSIIPHELQCFLNDKQRCLLHILKSDYVTALNCNPCALTFMLCGSYNYSKALYTHALEQLQKAHDLASCNGYVSIMLYCQIFIANVYSDLGDLLQMQQHRRIALRLCTALHNTELTDTVNYNFYATKLECGEYEEAYRYFSALQSENAMTLHKLAICCEKLGKFDEASKAIQRAIDKCQDNLDRRICLLVQYRLEHPQYLKDSGYGELLTSTFRSLRDERSVGYAKFHAPWVEEWCIANRKYRQAYEILRDFPK